MSESKPTPAVGQQWVNPNCNPQYNPHTIVELRSIKIDDRPVPGVLMRTANGETREWPIDGRNAIEAMMFWTYAGGPPPSPVSGGMMGADAEGLPVRCLRCNGPKNRKGWICPSCCAPWGNGSELISEWEAGARDFPRLPQPSQGAPNVVIDRGLQAKKRPGVSIAGGSYAPSPGTVGIAIDPGIDHRPPLSGFSLAPIYRGVGEMRSQDGRPLCRHGWTAGCAEGSCAVETRNDAGPLSALEAIKAKREPEPWVPSVDEYDLLPDAGT